MVWRGSSRGNHPAHGDRRSYRRTRSCDPSLGRKFRLIDGGERRTPGRIGEDHVCAQAAYAVIRLRIGVRFEDRVERVVKTPSVPGRAGAKERSDRYLDCTGRFRAPWSSIQLEFAGLSHQPHRLETRLSPVTDACRGAPIDAVLGLSMTALPSPVGSSSAGSRAQASIDACAALGLPMARVDGHGHRRGGETKSMPEA